MTIGKRLGLGFSAIIVLLVLVGGIGLMRMRELNGATTRLAEDRFQRVRLVERGVALINQNARLALHLFAVGEPGEFERDLASQSERTQEITVLYAEFRPLLDSDEERAAFDAVGTARAAYVEPRREAERLLRSGLRVEALAMFDKNVLPKLDEYIRAWDRFLAVEGKQMDDVAAEARDTYARARLVMVALIVLAAALAASVAIVVTRQITRPIRAIADAAGRLERGELGARVEAVSTNEIGALARAFNLMGEAVAFRQERLEREMSLAQRIQTAILPSNLRVPALEVSAAMRPATEVGGDYYDVLPVEDGCWLGMGDVAGHGLDAGLVMLMIQSSVATLVRENPNLTPRAIVSIVNEVIYENLNERLRKIGHATMVLLHFRDDGAVTFAGAHEELLVCRASTGRSEAIETPGTWVGGVAKIDEVTVDSSIHLYRGDVMLLFSDGLTEARNAKGEMFGIERLSAELERVASEPVETIRDRLLGAVTAWAPIADDDLSLVVARYVGLAETRAAIDREALRPSGV